MGSASDLFEELKGIQKLLNSSPTTSVPVAPPYQRPLTGGSGSSAAAGGTPQAGAAPAQTLQAQELQRLVAQLRQQQLEGENKCQRLKEALAAAQQDGDLVARRLQAQLLSKQEESTQLAALVLQLRQEAEELRQQLQAVTEQAQHSAKSSLDSITQLQQAAAGWREQGKDSMQLLGEEQARSASLQADTHRLQQEVDRLQAELQEERQQHQAAADALAALKAAGSSNNCAMAAELKQRLQIERSWRKAVCQWLQGEMQGKNELERVLVNVGTAVRVGNQGQQGESSSRESPTVPLLPPRHLVAGQVMSEDAATFQHAAVPSSVTVTVHSPRATIRVASSGVGEGSPGVSLPTSAGGAGPGWRQQFEATLKAFDQRHSKLQQELQMLGSKALQAATCTASL